MQRTLGFCFVLLVMLLSATVVFAGGGQEEAEQTEQITEEEEAAEQQTTGRVSMTDMESKWRDPNMPEAWFSEPQKASEAGITSFDQSPMLDERVANGELPPVEERLPDDPPVVVPYEKVGKYGGTMRVFHSEFLRPFTLYTGGGAGQEGLNMARPDGTGYFPWIADDIRLKENDTVVEVEFREGLKWSDGTPFHGGDEYAFYWNHSLNKEENDPSQYSPPLEDIVKVDKNTVQLHYGAPFPTVSYTFNHAWVHDIISMYMPIAPMHIMRQNLPEFVGQDEALANAKELGFSSVQPFLNELAIQSRELTDPRYEVATMQAYVPVERTETELIMERNPYYPFVDSEGNQLPYIDKLVVRFASQEENIELKATSGEADVAIDSVSAKNIPIYKQKEEDGNYTTYIHLNAALNKPFYSFNFTPPEDAQEYAEYYRNDKFRQALSLAINRKQVNDRFYFGQAIPMQVTIAPMSDLFKSEYASAYAQYDPERARKMLDEVGLRDTNGDGFREFPDGSEFRLKMMYANAPYLSSISIHEYVVSNWNDVGIAVDINTVNEGVFWERSPALQWEMKPHIVDGSLPNPLGLVKLALAPVIVPEVAPFGSFSTYFRTDGEEGERPPEDMYDELKMLYEAGTKYLETLDDQYLKPLLESQAEHIWAIGTVGFPPRPIIVNNRIKNVPEKILWDEALGRERLLYPMQWYIEE